MNWKRKLPNWFEVSQVDRARLRDAARRSKNEQFVLDLWENAQKLAIQALDPEDKKYCRVQELRVNRERGMVGVFFAIILPISSLTTNPQDTKALPS